jgi:hypothetical protein
MRGMTLKPKVKKQPRSVRGTLDQNVEIVGGYEKINPQQDSGPKDSEGIVGLGSRFARFGSHAQTPK